MLHFSVPKLAFRLEVIHPCSTLYLWNLKELEFKKNKQNFLVQRIFDYMLSHWCRLVNIVETKEWLEYVQSITLTLWFIEGFVHVLDHLGLTSIGRCCKPLKPLQICCILLLKAKLELFQYILCFSPGRICWFFAFCILFNWQVTAQADSLPVIIILA